MTLLLLCCYGILETLLQIKWQTWHKADAAAPEVSCGVCFEALACVLTSAGANVLVMSNTFVTFLAIKTSQGSLILSILSLIPAPLCYLKAWK